MCRGVVYFISIANFQAFLQVRSLFLPLHLDLSIHKFRK
ncbi:hypothetical protein N44_01457 [Microcystis aeruginosa NIES-44]|uniref:Uncharacterized protein n=1 Tax=Microcystis aeruginosa NIES-44 TaxID=449439 RepID=A0A0A1VPF5_MICAE|nr:hypothetical protein N44_01457 [Microcystis aeruginosa NIES-44]